MCSQYQKKQKHNNILFDFIIEGLTYKAVIHLIEVDSL